jgi:hypothetical protein
MPCYRIVGHIVIQVFYYTEYTERNIAMGSSGYRASIQGELHLLGCDGGALGICMSCLDRCCWEVTGLTIIVFPCFLSLNGLLSRKVGWFEAILSQERLNIGAVERTGILRWGSGSGLGRIVE